MELVKELNGNAFTLTIKGHVDAATAPDLEKVAMEEGAKVEKMVFDFSGVEYISSAGLRVLLQSHKLMSSKGGEFIVQNLTDDVKEILEMTGFSGFLTIK